MSEPTYLALAPMNRMLHSVEPPRPPDEYSVPLGGYDQRHHPSVPPRLPPSRKSSVHEATHNYLADLKIDDESIISSVASSIPAWSGSLSNLTMHVGASFLELTPRRDSNGP
ncbi:hypothetical protein CISG_02644 [Coccidioides immitis RMSCC 3703]|uniref:Uncharacterized protein n=1 Tax=Coccidioides immitis RMSCC 3703 TaxID=454286 RepID=A0A0J8U3F1_COCIT|nr:hypothetical protein CISG_02644 [Coccidioides immitis RMSCC 3703]